MADVVYRLHPFSVIIQAVRLLASLFYLVVAVVIIRFTGGASGPGWFEYLAAFAAGFQLLYAAILVFSLRYGFEGESLVVKTGIVWRQVRTIPVDRIQNVDFQRTLLHRLLGLADVKIDTATAASGEARLSALAVADAERLRAELIRRRGAAPGFTMEPDREPEPFFQARFGDLVLAGATQNRAGVIVSAIFGFFYFVGDLGDPVKEGLRRSFYGLVGGGPMATALATAVALAVLVWAGWIVSVFFTIVGYHGFRLRFEQGRLVRDFGLLTQLHSVIPVRRIQVMWIEAPMIRRLMGYCTVYASTAGNALEREDGGQTVGKSLLCPILPAEEVGRFCKAFWPDLDLDQVRWRPVAPNAVIVWALTWAFAFLILGGVLVVWLGWAWAWALVLLLPYGFWLSLRRHRLLRWARQDGYVLARLGWWKVITWAVPESKIQHVTVSQGPLQRMLGLATLSIGTASGGPTDGQVIKQMRENDARELLGALSLVADSSGDWHADGV
jgi:putative membrane protein